MMIEIRSKCFSLLPLVGGGGAGLVCDSRSSASLGPYLAHQLKFIKCEDML